MSVTEDRKFTKEQVYSILQNVKGKTLGEVDKSKQFSRTEKNSKITGIAGDVVEQSVFGIRRDNRQECDIEIDGVLTELKTTGVRVQKKDLPMVKNLIGEKYNTYLRAKEGISITQVTFEPDIQRDFLTSHLWKKSERMLIVFYEYKSYEAVPASDYHRFKIVDYCYNTFSEIEKAQLRNDWEIVYRYLADIYSKYKTQEDRNEKMIGFTHILRPQLLILELVPAFKRTSSGSWQKPRYRLKQTFVDYIIRGHFNKSRKESEINLNQPFTSLSELYSQCHHISTTYKGMTLLNLREILHIDMDIATKDFTSICILRMFNTQGSELNKVKDFQKVGIIAKTITLTPEGNRTEDMKLKHIDFEEWADRDIDFEDSIIYEYFCEHSFLFPIFCEHQSEKHETTTFEGFKRLLFDDNFIENEVRKTWNDSRRLIYADELRWEFSYDKDGNRRKNKSGSYMGAPNFPKSSQYNIFFRGGANDSREKAKTECVNGIKMLPQYLWLKGSYIAETLKNIPYI